MAQQPIISSSDRSQLKRNFRKDLKSSVEVTFFGQRSSVLTIPGRECRFCPQTQQLMEELVALSPKLQLNTVDFYQDPDTAKSHGVTRIPGIVLAAAGPDAGASRIKFYGIPSGYLMSVVVDDIKTISRGLTPLSNESKKQLRRVNQPVHIQVFATPNQIDCLDIARLSHAFALECPSISADVVEVQEYPAVAQHYGVSSVPLTVINEQYRFSGPAAESQLLDKVLQAGVRQEATPETTFDPVGR